MVFQEASRLYGGEKEMLCPYCHTDNNGVKDSRPAKKNRTIRRRRHCNNCHIRFSTVEWVEHKEIAVCKRNGETEPFDFDKLTRSLNTALRKRRVDRKLTVSELGSYVQSNVKEQAAAKGWNQTPELQGASERVLVQF